MNALKIMATWDENAEVWVATSDDVLGLAIEASTMDALIERLKIVIPELLECNHQVESNNEIPFVLEGRFTGKITARTALH
jgi:predicted RNase H-like HicB family nuclease